MAESCLTITVVGTPQWNITNIRASKTTVNVGESFTVSADIYNTGSASGTANVYLKVNGTTQDSKSVTVNPGSYQTVSFTLTATQVGSMNICIGVS